MADLIYSIEIIYDGDAPGEVQRHVVRNLRGGKMMMIREGIINAGLFIPGELPHEGEIILPWRIRKFYITIDEFTKNQTI